MRTTLARVNQSDVINISVEYQILVSPGNAFSITCMLRYQKALVYGKLLHESTQGHARNNPTKLENLTLSENVVFQQPRPQGTRLVFQNLLMTSLVDAVC